MGWELLIPLIVSQGLEVAEYIWSRKGQQPTAEDWRVLKDLRGKDARSQFMNVVTGLGLSETDPRVQEILKLIPAMQVIPAPTPPAPPAPPTP